MDIKEEYKYLFEKRVMKKGRLYFLKGSVSDVAVEENTVSGTIHAEKTFHSSIRFYPDHSPEMNCSCPFYSEWGKNCKHLWALVLHLDYLVAEHEVNPGDLFGDPEIRNDGWPALKKLIHEQGKTTRTPAKSKKAGFHICYYIDRDSSAKRGKLVFRLKERYRKLNGRWGREREYSGKPGEGVILDSLDERILTVFAGQEHMNGKVFNSGGYTLSGDLHSYVLPLMGRTSRLKFEVKGSSEGENAEINLSKGWDFFLKAEKIGSVYRLNGVWSIGRSQFSNDEITVVVPGEFSWLLRGNTLYRNTPEKSRLSGWESYMMKNSPLDLSQSEFKEFIKSYNRQRGEMPQLKIDNSFGFSDIKGESAVPLMYIHMSHGEFWGEPAFLYDGVYEFSYRTASEWYIDLKNGKRIKRNTTAEKAFLAKAEEAGFVIAEEWLYCNPESIHSAVSTLSASGWTLYGENRRQKIVSGSMPSIQVKTGIDWFEIEGIADFDGTTVPVGLLLKGIRKGTAFIELGDGNLGLMPEQWLRRFRDFSRQSEDNGDSIRVSKSRIGIFAPFEDDLSLEFDSAYYEISELLEDFKGIRKGSVSKKFKGELRDYQKEGLGWFEFLDTFGFGGCLSDDMGLGKTVQLLGFLDKKKHREGKLSCLIVVPASIVFNWVNEITRFTPGLKCMRYWGSGRDKLWKSRDEFNIILTSYSTMVRDIELLSREQFDFLVFDESQNLKNPRSKRTLSARRLKSNRRISLTGTPLENHLGDLWSQFSILNPGLFGTLNEFKQLFIENDNTEHLKKLVAPFILRRTKEQVLDDLPDKVEKILKCEMTGEQREFYDEIRDAYRSRILNLVDSDGIEKAHMNILEGLLRLRQVCCSPRLVDRRRKTDSGKFTSLMQMIEEVAEEGHKVLVFSQFVKMLGLIRERLDTTSIQYEYLDGKTRDREKTVNSFQEDPAKQVFLISLKAGGVGLNLTAADYVFLFDPWWNPAVEFQAVDRAHRIGQKNTVFTYRFLTHGSIEEKIQELQGNKKKMMDEIVNSSSGVVSSLTREDIEYLFS